MSTWDLRLGRWQDALADVGDVDAVITDPPFSQRTAEGFRGGDQHGATATERRAVGAEMDPATYAKARKRLEGGYTPDLFGAAL